MAQVTLKGNPVNVDGQLPQKGAQARPSAWSAATSPT